MRIRNLAGIKFGRLTVGSLIRNPLWKRPKWECRCECGQVRLVLASKLVLGHTKSCGCTRAESVRMACTVHGHCAGGKTTPEFRSWMCAKARVTCPTNVAFKDYGGRGILMCERWLNSFTSFFSDMGLRPPGMSLERKNNNGPYSPENCVWADRRSQANNQRTTVMVCIDGITKSISDWARSANLKRSTVYCRYWRGTKGRKLLEAI